MKRLFRYPFPNWVNDIVLKLCEKEGLYYNNPHKINWVIYTDNVKVIKLTFPIIKKAYFIKYWEKIKQPGSHCWDNYQSELRGLLTANRIFKEHYSQLSAARLVLNISEYQVIITENIHGIPFRRILLKQAFNFSTKSSMAKTLEYIDAIADWIIILQAGSCYENGITSHDLLELHLNRIKLVDTIRKYGLLDAALISKLTKLCHKGIEYLINVSDEPVYSHGSLEMQDIIIHKGKLSVLDFGEFTVNGDRYEDISMVWSELGLYGLYGTGSIKRVLIYQNRFLERIFTKIPLDRRRFAVAALFQLVRWAAGTTDVLMWAKRAKKPIIRIIKNYQLKCYFSLLALQMKRFEELWKD